MQSIEFNNLKFPIINLMYEMLVELKNQKSISHCERFMRMKYNEAAAKKTTGQHVESSIL